MFGKLKKMFQSKSELSLVAPLDGEVVAMADIPDPVFAQGMIGQALAIKPSSNVVKSPVKGTVFNVFHTLHAISLVSENGVEVIVHIGLDTVKQEGKGFTAFVKDGDKVEIGDKLIEFDQEKLEGLGYDMTTPVVITNSANYKDFTATEAKTVKTGDAFLSFVAQD